MAYLPQELVDSIIDYLSDQHSSLFSCSLVSRSWLHSSRSHLFANISLSPHAVHTTLPPHKLCQRLYHLLQTSPVIIPYIRHLQVIDGGGGGGGGGPPTHHHHHHHHQRSVQWITTERTLPPLLKLLTHLRQFELGASSCPNVLQWKSLPFTLQNAICTLLKLPSLSFFKLHSSTFPNLVSLAAVISSCQHLKGLSLSSVTVSEELDHYSEFSASSTPKSIPLPHLQRLDAAIPTTTTTTEATHSHTLTFSLSDNDNDNSNSNSNSSEDDTVDTRGIPTPRLEALTLDYVNFGYLGYWLFTPPSSPSPQQFTYASSSPINFGSLRELRISHSADPLVVDQILKSIGPSLEFLHLKPGNWDVYPFDLKNNPNLQSLRLSLESSETALSWCTTLLSSLSSSSSPYEHQHQHYDDDDVQLTYLSLEFWTDLKKLSYTRPPSPQRRSSSTSSTSSSSSSSSSTLSSSSTSSTLLSSVSLSSSPSSSSLSLLTTTTDSRRSPSPSSSSSSIRSTTTTQQTAASTWSSLDSILSLLPAPNLKQIDIGLFAQSTSPDFIRVKEILSRRCILGSKRSNHDHHDDNDDHDVDDDGNGGSLKEGGVEEGSEVEESLEESEEEEEEEKMTTMKTKGVVRVYQLGLKSQRSNVGRLSGPRLRFFETVN